MSDTLSDKVWIENFVLSCARKYGSKFAKPTEQKGYRVQLIEFLTRRTPEQPDAAIWALASDGQYYIPVKFATNAINEFRGIDGKSAILEDHWCGIFILKGTFTLQYYRVPRKYISGKPNGLEDTKRLYLEVTHVQYVGSMHEPIFVRPRVLKRDGMPDFVIEQEAVESVGNVVAVKRWIGSLEKGDGDVLKQEWDAQNAEEVAARANAEQRMLSVSLPTAPRYLGLLSSANKRKEINCAPSEHWPSFWKQTFKEYPWLFDSGSSEGSDDEEYLKEGDADASHEILVPILTTDKFIGSPVKIEAPEQPLEPEPPTPVPPILPVVPSTPSLHSSPSLTLTDWSPTPPHRLRTRSCNMEDVTESPDETTQRTALGKGEIECGSKATTPTTSRESPPCFLKKGSATSNFGTHTEQSPTSNRLSLEASEPDNQALVPSTSQAKLGRQPLLGAGSLRHLQLPFRRAHKHRGELRTEYSTSYTVPIKRKSTPQSFPLSQPLFSQPRASSTQELVPASVEETSHEITSSDSIRIPPGQMFVTQESQESRSKLKNMTPESAIEAFVDNFSWEVTARESVEILSSGQIAITQESQESSPKPQNTGEARVSSKAPDPLTNKDHRWKSKIVNAMLSSPPVYTPPSAPNSPAAETSVGPMDSPSPLSDGDTAYRQYIEDNLRAKEREDSSDSCEEWMGSQLEIHELDSAGCKAPSTDRSGENDEETDTKKEGPTKQSGTTAGEEEHTQQLADDIEVEEQHKPSQGLLEQETRFTSGPEALPTRNENRVEKLAQPAEDSAHIGPTGTEGGDHQKQIDERLVRTPVQELQASLLGELGAKEVKATQWEAEEAHQADSHEEIETDDARAGKHKAENRGVGGIERMLPPEAREMRLAVESTVPLETAREELQDIGLQRESLRTHSHSPLTTTPTSLHWPPKARAPRRLPWHLAESNGGSPSASISSLPSPPKHCQVLGKRKRASVGDDVREQTRTPPSSSILKISVKQANSPEMLLQPPVLRQGVIKRRKVEFVDTPLEIDFEESGSDSDGVPIDNWRPRRERDEKAPAIQVQDGSPFFCNKSFRPPSFDVPSPLSPIRPQDASIPGGRKVQSRRLTLHAHQPALSVVPSTSVRKHQQPMALSKHCPRRVSAQPNTVQQRLTCPVPSRAYTRHPPPVSSLFCEDRSFGYRPSGRPPFWTDHSDFSEFGEVPSIISTDTLPHVDFLKREPVLKRRSSSTRSLRR